MSSRFGRAWRGVLFACLWFGAASAPALAHQEGAIGDGHGGTVALASGELHSCALRSDGSAVCWGSNAEGQATPPPGERFIALTASRTHSCGLRGDGSALCWGSAPPVEPQTYTALTSTDHDLCGLTMQGTIACWPGVPEGPFAALSAGAFHACGLRGNGQAECWGNNDYGQATAPAGTFSAIAAGRFHSCGLRSDGSVSCWGDNNFGQTNINGGMFTAVSVGTYFSCAIRLDGSLYCWGDGYDGVTTPPVGTFTALSAGAFHACALRNDGHVLCWGRNYEGQTSAPTDATFGAVHLDAGDLHTCELRTDGTPSCWGDDSQGQLYPPFGAGPFIALASGDMYSCAASPNQPAQCWGHDGYGERNVPSDPLRLLRAGRHHICAVTVLGETRCWGWDNFGQAQAPAGRFRELGAGFVHSCGVYDDGTGACWGFNGDGQATVPTLPDGVSYVSIQAGERHSCALRSDGFISCWGMDYDNGTQYPPTGYFRALSVGAFHNCAIRTDGRLWCWGANWYGQTDAPSGRFVSITSGVHHSCAVRENGLRACWGDNAKGQAPQLSLQPQWLDGFTFGQPVQLQLSAVRSPDTTPVAQARFSISAGTLPPGLSLGTDGLLQGTPTEIGQYTVTLAVEDERGFGVEREYTLSIDATPPQIDYYILGTRGSDDWMVSGGRIEWYVWDWDSGVRSTSGCEMTFFNVDTTGQDYTCSGESAGGTASRTVRIKLDATAPETAFTTTPGATSSQTQATFAFAGSDATSGVSRYECSLDNATAAACTSPMTVTVAAGNHRFVVQAIDAAGNRDATPAVHNWQVDTTPPQIVPTVSGTLGNNGWYVSNVQIGWSVSDPDSAIATSTGCNTVTLSSDSAGAGFTCTATSAGGSGSQTVTIKRDATAPVIAAAATTAPNAAGWYNTAVIVAFSCNDALSGTTGCPAAQVLQAEGVDVISSVRSIVDAAGNTASSNTVHAKIDRTAPTLAPTVAPGTLLLNGSANANANGNDTLSGMAQAGCAALDSSSVGNRSTICTVTDAAGNSASADAAYRVVYGFAGFTAPVQNPSTLNVLKAGRSVPLRWRVVDAQGAPVTNLGSANVNASTLTCPSASENRISTYGGSNGQLQNLGNGYYQLDWMAASALRGACRLLDLDLGDGQSHPAQFKFN